MGKLRPLYHVCGQNFIGNVLVAPSGNVTLRTEHRQMETFNRISFSHESSRERLRLDFQSFWGSVGHTTSSLRPNGFLSSRDCQQRRDTPKAITIPTLEPSFVLSFFFFYVGHLRPPYNSNQQHVWDTSARLKLFTCCFVIDDWYVPLLTREWTSVIYFGKLITLTIISAGALAELVLGSQECNKTKMFESSTFTETATGAPKRTIQRGAKQIGTQGKVPTKTTRL